MTTIEIHRPRRARAAFAALSATALLIGGCGSSGDSAADPGADTATLTVFAAASLQASFDDLSAKFTEQHPGVKIGAINYDGSQALATQIVNGATVDVIAFADQPSLKPVTAAGITDAGTIFATNTLQIAVAPGNPKHITGLADLAKPGVSVVLCAPKVPCGNASQTLLKDANVQIEPVSEETNVTSVALRVKEGEADAGLIYRTDVTAAAGRLEGITPANADQAVNRYPIAVSKKAPAPQAAQEFEDFVLSPAGQEILKKYGFGAP